MCSFGLLQFIVVSLKDGMFTNANVLFRTRFVDGVSMVTRYTQNPQKKAAPLGDKNTDSTSTVEVKPKASSDLPKGAKAKRAKV